MYILLFLGELAIFRFVIILGLIGLLKVGNQVKLAFHYANYFVVTYR